ncbi:MAG: PorP/SprF family type IX secretion system membrane protein [Bacteroidota bacterium]
MKTANLLITTFLLLAFVAGKAQDIHFSQFGNSPLNLNPALTGIFEGDRRFVANLRGQWNDTPDPSPLTYRTLSLAYDMSFPNQNYQKRFFSAGILLNYDMAGDSKLTTFNLGLTGSYTVRVSKEFYLSAGGMLAYNNRSFDFSDLQFDQQYDKETSQFDPNAANGESFSSNPSVNMFDVSGGLNLHYRHPQRSRRIFGDVGVGFMHFNEPEQAFLSDDDTEVLPMRTSIYGQATVQLFENSKWDVLINAAHQMQSDYRETILGAGLQWNHKWGSEEGYSINLMINRRLEDNWIPMLGFQHKNWRVTGSYDWNTSPFKAPAPNRAPALRRVGYELSIIHIWSTVKDVPTKICPVYL